MRVPLSANNSQAMCDESAGQLPAPQGMISRCFGVFWYSATLQSCLCSTPDFRSFHMGIALFTLSALQSPVRSLRRLFTSAELASADKTTLPAPAETRESTEFGNASPFISQRRAADAAALHGAEQHQAQRAPRGNWPFTAKPPARAPESPARLPDTQRSFLPTHMGGSKRQAFLSAVGTASCGPRTTKVLRRASDAAGTGRLVIAGRMADVCAELDRLAVSEALRA